MGGVKYLSESTVETTVEKEKESGEITEITVPRRNPDPYSLASLRDCEYCVFVE